MRFKVQKTRAPENPKRALYTVRDAEGFPVACFDSRPEADRFVRMVQSPRARAKLAYTGADWK